MAKRFTDTGIWEKEWFMKLSPKHKCLFRYLTERCDAAGVWEPNWKLASIYIGEDVDFSDTVPFSDQLEKLPNGKIWLTGFITFQYGKLSDKSPAHIPVFKSIEKNSLYDRVFNRVSNRVVEKEKYKEEDKEEVKESKPDFEFQYELKEQAAKSIPEIKVNVNQKPELIEALFTDEIYVEQLQMAHRGKNIKEAFEECYTHHSNAPNPPQEVWEWKQKLNTWLSIKRKDNGTTKKGTDNNSRREAFAKRYGSGPNS